jgi:hypothetical protein
VEKKKIVKSVGEEIKDKSLSISSKQISKNIDTNKSTRDKKKYYY